MEKKNTMTSKGNERKQVNLMEKPEDWKQRKQMQKKQNDNFKTKK